MNSFPSVTFYAELILELIKQPMCILNLTCNVHVASAANFLHT